MIRFKTLSSVVCVLLLLCCWSGPSDGGQVWITCHITCRCLCDNSVSNLQFVIPIDRSPDVGFEADEACKSYGHRICGDNCNGTKFTYTYQITSP